MSDVIDLDFFEAEGAFDFVEEECGCGCGCGYHRGCHCGCHCGCHYAAGFFVTTVFKGHSEQYKDKSEARVCLGMQICKAMSGGAATWVYYVLRQVCATKVDLSSLHRATTHSAVFRYRKAVHMMPIRADLHPGSLLWTLPQFVDMRGTTGVCGEVYGGRV